LSSKYIVYGLSTLFGRGLEYLMLLLVASKISKTDYGQFEFYKKTIELSAILISFGTPTLLLTYTKSSSSKINFTLISMVFCLILTGLLSPLFYYFDLKIILFPVLFYALFFYSNSIVQSFNLVEKGSNFTAYYKIIGSVLFNSLIVFFILNTKEKSKSLILASNVCLVFFVIYYLVIFFKYYGESLLTNIKRYVKLFIKLIYSSLTLVINNFTNITFLYTDIYIIKLFADETISNSLIAEYSFPLNIANALLIIPLTISQVDIEKVKNDNKSLQNVVRKIVKALLISLFLVLFIYYLILQIGFMNYKGTILIFIIILCAKFIQGLTTPYGMMMIIRKHFNFNLGVNLGIFLFNAALSIILFDKFKLTGIAFASLLSLLIRYIMISVKVNKILSVDNN
jgi:O-antigen/teichoic acid export membrane protein